MDLQHIFLRRPLLVCNAGLPARSIQPQQPFAFPARKQSPSHWIFKIFLLLSKAVNQTVEVVKTEGGRGVGSCAEHPGKLWIKCFILIIITNHGGTIRIIRRKIIPQGRDKGWGREGKGGAAECSNPHGMWLSPDKNIPRLTAIMKFHFSIFLIYTDTYINYLGEVFQFPANGKFALKCFDCEIPRYINFHSLRMLSSPSG